MENFDNNFGTESLDGEPIIEGEMGENPAPRQDEEEELGGGPGPERYDIYRDDDDGVDQGSELTAQEEEELRALEAWEEEQRRLQAERRARLELLRRQKAAADTAVSASLPSTRQVLPPTTPNFDYPTPAPSARPSPTPSMMLDVNPVIHVTPSRGPLGSGRIMGEKRPVDEMEKRLDELMDNWSTKGQGGTAVMEENASKEPEAKKASTSGASPVDMNTAMVTMTSAVTKLATVLAEQKEASVLKWERKKPTIKMAGPEEFMNELIGLENAYAETGARTYARRWAIFRPSLEGRAKETVEVELERRSLTAEAISKFEEKDYRVLYDYLLAYMEKSVGLTPEKKVEIALASMSRVGMADHSGPADAEKFVSDYKRAYLLELRAGLVEDTPVSTTKRLYEMRQKMSPELRSYLKGLPSGEQPTTLELTYDSVRRWAEKERAGNTESSGGGGGRRNRRQERHYEVRELDYSKKPANHNADQPAASNLSQEAILNLVSSGISQALSKAGIGGKGTYVMAKGSASPTTEGSWGAPPPCGSARDAKGSTCRS